ncbi:uncharacterized protein LOC21400980 isoform X1 [Morus notabilis]|uniref:uncharacterized protein LOC21400980 isoform X1 n=1 Tax=Morus notabilis TaxID=981085 RepID=UPI000CED1FF9|nr:uncharacterized protein LOC21400980 isoform X1 [Morus notabilis]
MAKLPINPLLLLSRRTYSYAVAAENVRVQPVAAAAAMRPMAAAKEAVPAGTNKKEDFWMRDPKTGNWVPESHLGDDQIDVADLREKLLSKNHKKTTL